MHLIGDIGGTNIRLGLLDKGRIHSKTYLLAADFPDLRNAITYYLSTQPEAKVSRAALAVASPIISDQVKTVHSHLNFSICS